MKLKHLHVHNFRGILDQDFNVMDYSLLVGPNNSGKSTFIDALRAFYEKDGFQFKPSDDFPHILTEDDESWIDLTFTLTKGEEESLADNYRDGSEELRVRKYFKTTRKKADSKSATGAILGYLANGELADEAFYGAKNVQSGKFGDLVHIPAISKVDEHAKLSGPSALRDLLSDIMADVIEGGAAFPQFTAGLDTFSQAVRVEETEDKRSLSGFESELNDMLASWDTKFRLTFPSPSAASIIKNLLNWEIIDSFHGKSQSVEHYGSGFQRHLIYSLIQLGAQYIGKKPTKKKKDFTPDLTLVLFEEPEAFLHPPQQIQLARNLRSISSKETWQVICSTHSSHFVSRQASDIPSIVRLRRSDGVIKAAQIGTAEWKNIIDSNAAINPIAKKYSVLAKRLHEDDAKPDMDAVRHFLWLNPDRSSAFFANHVLLVEGPSEVAFINRLVGDGSLAGDYCGLYVLDCIGKFNIHRFMNLLGALGIAHAVLHDDDHQKDWHAEINQLIADSQNVFTTHIGQLPGVLEDVLGIPAAGAPHRKPQHVLYQYEIGKITVDNLDAFCKILCPCLPIKASKVDTTGKSSTERL